VDVYTGPGQVLTGAARLQQEARDREAEQARSMEIERREHTLTEERASIEAQLRILKAKLDALKDEGSYVSRKESERRNRGKRDREEASDIRQADKKAVR